MYTRLNERLDKDKGNFWLIFVSECKRWLKLIVYKANNLLLVHHIKLLSMNVVISYFFWLFWMFFKIYFSNTCPAQVHLSIPKNVFRWTMAIPGEAILNMLLSSQYKTKPFCFLRFYFKRQSHIFPLYACGWSFTFSYGSRLSCLTLSAFLMPHQSWFSSIFEFNSLFMLHSWLSIHKIVKLFIHILHFVFALQVLPSKLRKKLPDQIFLSLKNGSR